MSSSYQFILCFVLLSAFISFKNDINMSYTHAQLNPFMANTMYEAYLPGFKSI